MSKRRTKKEKAKAHHQFRYNWQAIPLQRVEPQNVKGQIENDPVSAKTLYSNTKNAISTAKDEKNISVKRDLVKSLIVVSLILALELMLYLAVNR